ncbi:MAG: hypothetical protein U5L01_05100 [Rheinheimera sp.]|nr:hypothetical protein [Rheinheimera sp.]
MHRLAKLLASVLRAKRNYNGKVQWQSTMAKYNGKVQWQSTMTKYSNKVQWQSNAN